MKKKKILLGLTLAAAALVALASCGGSKNSRTSEDTSKEKTSDNNTSLNPSESESGKPSEISGSGEASKPSDTEKPTETSKPADTEKTVQSTVIDTTTQGGGEETTTPEEGEKESIGYGTGYTAFSTLFANSTEKDTKGRTILGTTGTLYYGNGYGFDGKSVLDGSVLNTQASAFTVTLDKKATLSIKGTWGSSDAGKVQILDLNNNVVYESTSSYASKDSVTVLKELEKGTYTIKCVKDKDGTGASIAISQTYYEYIVERVTVSYVTNCDTSIDNSSIVKGRSITNLPELQKSGFKFIGWYTDSKFDNPYNGEAIETDTILYAKFEELTQENSSTVKFVANISGVSFDDMIVEKGKSFTLPSKSVTGYRFDGWYSDAAMKTAYVSGTVVNDDITLYAKYVKQYTITYLDIDNNVFKTLNVDENTPFSEVASPSAGWISGKEFKYWSLDGETEFLGSEDINSNITLKPVYGDEDPSVEKINVVSVNGYEESAEFVVSAYKNATDFAVYNIESGSAVQYSTDNCYVVKSGSNYKIYLFGIKAGSHRFLIAPVINGESDYTVARNVECNVTAYDRSGYAHFNYTDGVGAYKDDGTLKENAIVLYVTDENKNTVTLSFHDSVNNKDYSVSGIGNILNSAGKDYNNTGLNSKGGLANTNDGVILALAQNNIPLVVRFIGCVSNTGLYKDGTFDAKNDPLIEGLTKYSSTDWGGTKGDNGHMARMQSGKNITFEGVGDDATIDGWGFHLICETAYKEYAKNFEVRNLTFINTPEDAIGMEGQEQESTLTLTASVERCWVHHNTFICPHISNEAASDKSEGDGSCDFKRGNYFTCSYNYFENCHKTNLVGSDDSSLQYNLTYHHNIWYQCAARQPLARRANIHFYNNYIYGTTDTVSSIRAAAYMYSENNYFYGCHRPVELDSSEGAVGACKSYGDALVGCYENDSKVNYVTSREQQVSSSCEYATGGIDYRNFDTNSSLFYYDSVNKKSDCYLTDASTARNECIAQAGSRYRTVLNKCELGSSTDITTAASTSTVSGDTSFTNLEGKDVIKVFTVTTPVTLTIAGTGESDKLIDQGYVVRKDGKFILSIDTTAKSAVLMPGEYVIISCVVSPAKTSNNKSTTITTCTFEKFNSEELNQQLIEEYNTAKNAIPSNITYTDSVYNLIKDAMTAYNGLGELQSQVDYTVVQNAYNQFKALGVAYVEGLISAIGTVDETKGTAIVSARNAYNQLIARCSDVTVSNYSTLTQAETAFNAYAVTACINAIDAIGTVTLSSEDAIVYAEGLYKSLDSTQQAQVTNYKTLTDARATYDDLVNANDVDELITNTSLDASKADLYAVVEAYDALTDSQKSLITNVDKYNSIAAKYVDLLIDEIPATIDFSNMATVSAARSAFDKLNSTQKALVSGLSDLEAAEAQVKELGVETLDTYSTTDFSTWNITGATTSTTAGLIGGCYTGNTITATSKFMMSGITKISVNITSEDKGSTNYNIYTSTDGKTWTSTPIATFANKNNTTAEDYSATVTVTGPVYIKVELTCTKGKAKSTALNSISINI